MTVHCYRLVIDPASDAGKAHTEVENRVGQDKLALRGQERPCNPTDSNDDFVDVAAIHGLYRIVGSESRTNADNAFKGVPRNVNPTASWWLIHHHTCRHDHSPVEPCDAWTLVESNGTVPPEVEP